MESTCSHLLSANIGKPRPNPWKPVALTGIDKRPVSGAVMGDGSRSKGTGAVGLVGDAAYDVKHHGGTDQAVYAYAREYLDFWQTELDTALRNGNFGENLTSEGLDVTGALIGERWRAGKDVILEVSCPRTPCGTFQGWLDRAGWIKRFTEAAKPGAYLRVTEPGLIPGRRPGQDRTPPRPRRNHCGRLQGADHRTGSAASPARRRGAVPVGPRRGPQAHRRGLNPPGPDLPPVIKMPAAIPTLEA